jgi:hypothetical protein
MRKTPIRIVVALALLGPCRCFSAVPYVEVGGGRRQGTFGTATDSTLWLGYLSLGSSGERWDANCTVPYLGLERTESGYYRQDKGLGDVVLQSDWRFMPETWEGWSLDGLAALKCPTADSEKDLGTGRTDLGVFLAVNQRLGLLRWSLLGGWIQGVSHQTGSNLTSGAYVFNLGTALSLETSRWELVFEVRGPSYQGGPGAQEISLCVFKALSPTWGIKASTMAGLTEASPRWSCGLALVVNFP